MSKKYIGSVVATLVLVTVSSCTGSGEAGKASPESSTTPTSQVAKKLPARPAEIKVDGVEPCKLLTADQMKQIKIAEGSSQQSKMVDSAPMPACFFSNNLTYSYLAVLATNKGVDYWLGDGGNVTVDVVDVAGYGAAEIKLIGVDDVDCAVAVDVAEGQQLIVDYKPDSAVKESQQQLCDKAKKAAGLALDTLKTLK